MVSEGFGTAVILRAEKSNVGGMLVRNALASQASRHRRQQE